MARTNPARTTPSRRSLNEQDLERDLRLHYCDCNQRYHRRACALRHAVSVWVAGDNLMVAFPGTRGEQGHTIRLPASAGGLQAAITILKDRAQARDLRLSNRGTPSQWDLENDKRYSTWLVAMAKAKEAKAKSADETLAELDL